MSMSPMTSFELRQKRYVKCISCWCLTRRLICPSGQDGGRCRSQVSRERSEPGDGAGNQSNFRLPHFREPPHYSLLNRQIPTPPLLFQRSAQEQVLGHRYDSHATCYKLYSQCGVHTVADTLILRHYNEVTMSAIASQISSLTIVYSTVYSSTDERKHQSPASLAFVKEIHR